MRKQVLTGGVPSRSDDESHIRDRNGQIFAHLIRS